MDEEYQSLMVNKTWSLVPLPTGRSAIGCRWAFKLKRGPDGSIQRYKARFVAKGYSQRPGVDYLETYSPVVKLDSLRCILSIASSRDLDMMQLDVKTAFLHGEVIEELYVNQPEGFIADGNESLVCKLHKGLYGLKQSSRLWNITFDSFITKFGFLSSSADLCVYFSETDPEFTILAVWVDDDPADFFIRLQISRDRPKKKLLLSQPQYILRMHFNMDKCHAITVPADPHARLDSSVDVSFYS